MENNQYQGRSPAKTCVICGQDCSNRPRVKDQRGLYYCKACHEKRHEPHAQVEGKPHADDPPVPAAAVPQPPQPADDLIPFADDDRTPNAGGTRVPPSSEKPRIPITVQQDGADAADDQGYEEVWTATRHGSHQGSPRTELGIRRQAVSSSVAEPTEIRWGVLVLCCVGTIGLGWILPLTLPRMSWSSLLAAMAYGWGWSLMTGALGGAVCGLLTRPSALRHGVILGIILAACGTVWALFWYAYHLGAEVFEPSHLPSLLASLSTSVGSLAGATAGAWGVRRVLYPPQEPDEIRPPMATALATSGVADTDRLAPSHHPSHASHDALQFLTPSADGVEVQGSLLRASSSSGGRRSGLGVAAVLAALLLGILNVALGASFLSWSARHLCIDSIHASIVAAVSAGALASICLLVTGVSLAAAKRVLFWPGRAALACIWLNACLWICALALLANHRGVSGSLEELLVLGSLALVSICISLLPAWLVCRARFGGIAAISAGLAMGIPNTGMAVFFWGYLAGRGFFAGRAAYPGASIHVFLSMVGWHAVYAAGAAFVGVLASVLILLAGIWLAVTKRMLRPLGLAALTALWLHACLWIGGITQQTRASRALLDSPISAAVAALLLGSAGVFVMLTWLLCGRPEPDEDRRARGSLFQPFVLLSIAVGWGTVVAGVPRWSASLKRLGDVSLFKGIDPMILLYGYGLAAPILGAALGFAALGLLMSRRFRAARRALTGPPQDAGMSAVIMIALSSILGLVEATLLAGLFFASVRDPWGISVTGGLIEVLFAVAIPASFVYMTYGRGLRSLFESWDTRTRDLLIAASLGVALAFAFGLVQFAARGVFRSTPETALALKRLLSVDDALGLVRVLVFVVVIPAVCEEFLFRGMLFRGLARWMSSPTAAIISALAFALAHFALPNAIEIFLMGLVLAWVVAYTRSIRPCIIVHGLVNLAAVIQVNWFAS